MNSKPSRQRLALFALFLITLWLGLGAFFKLFLGSPADLPDSVRTTLDTLGFGGSKGLDLAFHLMITVELAAVALCICKPKYGWTAITSIFLLFFAILAHLVYIGAESCGCAGGSIKIKPLHMLLVDSTLLIFLLGTRPWSAITTRGLHPGLLLVLLIGSGAAPWVVIDAQLEVQQPSARLVTEDGSTETGPVEWRLREPLPKYVIFKPEEWVDQELWETKLAIYIDPEELPLDGKLILYRIDCDHCADHLSELAMNDDATLPITLLRVVEAEAGDSLITLKPEGPHVTELELPELAWVVDTPSTIEVAGGLVLSYTFEKE